MAPLVADPGAGLLFRQVGAAIVVFPPCPCPRRPLIFFSSFGPLVPGRQLLDMLRFYAGFEINDFTGEAMTESQTVARHYEQLKDLQVRRGRWFFMADAVLVGRSGVGENEPHALSCRAPPPCSRAERPTTPPTLFSPPGEIHVFVCAARGLPALYGPPGAGAAECRRH